MDEVPRQCEMIRSERGDSDDTEEIQYHRAVHPGEALHGGYVRQT